MALDRLTLPLLLTAAVALSACASGGRTYSGTYAGDVSPAAGATPTRMEARGQPLPEPEPPSPAAAEATAPATEESAPAASPANPSITRSLTGAAPADAPVETQAAAATPSPSAAPAPSDPTPSAPTSSAPLADGQSSPDPARVETAALAEIDGRRTTPAPGATAPSPTPQPAAAPAAPRPSALAQSAPQSGSSVLASAPETPPEPVATTPSAVPQAGSAAARQAALGQTGSGSTDPRVQARSEQATRSVLAQAVPEVADNAATPRPPSGSDIGGVLPRPAAPGTRPALSDVPAIPDDLPSASEREAILQQLQRDRELLRQSRDAPPGGVGMLPTDTGSPSLTAPGLPNDGLDPTAQRRADSGLLTGTDGGVPSMPGEDLPLRTGPGTAAMPAPSTSAATASASSAPAPTAQPTTAQAGVVRPATPATATTAAAPSSGPEIAANGAQNVFAQAFQQSAGPQPAAASGAGTAGMVRTSAPAQPAAQQAIPVSAATDLAQTIAFAPGSASLTGPALGAVDQIAARALEEGWPVRVVGFASLPRADGTAVENTRLAMARANAVAGRLIGRGLPPTRVRVESGGVADGSLEQAQIFLP